MIGKGHKARTQPGVQAGAGSVRVQAGQIRGHEASTHSSGGGGGAGLTGPSLNKSGAQGPKQFGGFRPFSLGDGQEHAKLSVTLMHDDKLLFKANSSQHSRYQRLP